MKTVGFILLALFCFNSVYSQIFCSIPYESSDSLSFAVEYEYEINNGKVTDSTISKMFHFDNNGRLVKLYKSSTIVHDDYKGNKIMSMRWYQRLQYIYDDQNNVRYIIYAKNYDCNLKNVYTLYLKKFRANDKNMIALLDCNQFVPDKLGIEIFEGLYIDTQFKREEYIKDSISNIKTRLLESTNIGEVNCNVRKLNDTIVYECCMEFLAFKYKLAISLFLVVKI